MQELLRIFIYEILYNDVSSTRYVLNQVRFTSALYMHYFISNKQFDHLRNTVQWCVFYSLCVKSGKFYFGFIHALFYLK